MTTRGPGSSRSPQTFGQRWSWFQFTCAFVLFGVIAFSHVDPPLDGIWIHVVKTIAIAGRCGAVAGRFAMRIIRENLRSAA